jgi:hypothetical protein
MPVTFDDITGAVLSSQLGRNSAQSHVLNMITRLGDVAAVCATPEHVPSNFERTELPTLIGELAVALCGLGAALDVDVGIAAANVARQRCTDASAARSRKPEGHTLGSASTPMSAKHRPPPLANATLSCSPAAAAQPPQQQQQVARQQQQLQQQVESDDERRRWSNARESPGRAATGASQPRAAAGAAATDSDAAALLSPKTTASFFPELDKIVHLYHAGHLSRGEFEGLHMTYCVIDDHGEVIDLIPSGRSKRVSYDDFPSYARMAEPLRHGAPVPRHAQRRMELQQQQQQQQGGGHHHHQQQQQQQAPPLQQSTSYDAGLMSPTQKAASAPEAPPPMSAPGFETRRIPVDNRPDPRQHGTFSPDHFKGGLFSPHSDRAFVDVEYPSETRGAPRETQRAPQGWGQEPTYRDPNMTNQEPLTRASPGGKRGNGSSQAAGVDAALNESHTATPKEEASFWRKVAIIESREATGNAIAALELTLAMPHNGRWVPLTTNGEYIAVTAQNVEDFIGLIREQQQLRSGKLRRVDSVKPLAMPNVPSFNYKTEAKKYGHDRRTNSTDQLMAPAPPSRTVFYVDFDERAVGEVLPTALQRAPIPSMLPSAAHYIDFILSHPETFKDVVAACKRDKNMLARLQVTYCVPDPNALLSPHLAATLPAGSRPRCGMTDLVENGRNLRVSPQDFDNYYQLVRDASRRLPQSVAVA